MSYLDNVKNKRTEIAEASQKQASLDAFEKLSSEIRTLLSSLEKTGAKSLDGDFINAVKGLQNVANSLQSVKVTSDSDIKAALRTLTKAVNSIEVSPNIRVESPRVEVKEREIDLKPLIKELKQPAKTDPLAEYRAQDINDEDPNIQYVGFVNPSGAWYIIENNTLDNSLRYKFGKSNYAYAWKKPSKHSYKILNEALNEVSA